MPTWHLAFAHSLKLIIITTYADGPGDEQPEPVNYFRGDLWVLGIVDKERPITN
jgi:hypothetical protein